MTILGATMNHIKRQTWYQFLLAFLESTNFDQDFGICYSSLTIGSGLPLYLVHRLFIVTLPQIYVMPSLVSVFLFWFLFGEV